MAEADIKGTKPEESNLIVALRVRPMSEDEIIQGATPIAHKVDKNMVVLMDPVDPDDILRVNRSREKHYVFDYSLDGVTTQEEVYDHTTRFLIPQVIAGYNSTVFAYGATGAGKTYTMLGTDDDPGIMARSLNDLFLKMEESSNEMTYEVSMSYLEIYNELIRDLLQPNLGFLDLREDAKGVHIAGLSEVHARSTREVMDMLMKGNKERTQEPTAANKASSRSHAILQVNVKQRARVRNVMQEVRCGRLFLIDLAGSERAANTHNRGKRMVEGAHINRSLLALGNCINALSVNGAKYVNYRDSKLTRLLKDALGGNCKTVMIAHISPASIHFEESRNTLVYADRAKQIKTKVRKNVMDVSYHITQYTHIIAELRDEVKRLQTRLDAQQGKKNAAAIHAIQTEVMQAAISEDKTEVMKLKDQLLTVFNEQMELRRSLMDLNNESMELNLELGRNQLLLQKWEREKALSIRKRMDSESDDEKDKNDEKQRELSGSPVSEEPDEVRVAREEISTLLLEREKTEHVKSNVLKELENSRDRAARIEEALPRKITSADQQEILSLLCKVHELEIENMEMQSSCLLRNFELRQKDLLLAKHRHHHSLCHEIITQQRSLIDMHGVACPKELEEFYALYLQEVEEREEAQEEDTLPAINNDKNVSTTTLNRKFLESDSMSDMDRMSQADSASILGSRILVPSSFSTSTAFHKRLVLKRSSQNLSKLEENEMVFSRSPKAADLDQAPPSNSTAARLAVQRQPSILTLSSRSEATTPTPPKQESPKKFPNTLTTRKSTEDKQVIVSHTRSIAALAAQRKNAASLDVPLVSKNGSYLSASRLANHDRKYDGSNLTLNRLMDPDNVSIATLDHSVMESNRMGPGRPKYRPTKKSQAAANKGVIRHKKNKANETSYQQMTPEAFFSKLNKSTISRRPLDQASMSSMGRRSRLPLPPSTRAAKLQESDFDAPGTPSHTVQQKAPEKGKGLTVQKRIRGPAADSVSSSTNVPTGRTGKRLPPTIPAGYRKETFGITGHGLK